MRSTGFRVVILALILLSLLLLVPSSTPVAMGDSIVVGPFRLTAYGLCVAAGALLGMFSILWLGRRKKLHLHRMLHGIGWSAVGALLGARILYCAAMIESITVDFGYSFIIRFWEGGYTLFGGVLGGLAGAALYARISKQPLKPLLDCIAPGAALFLASARLGEAFTTQGLGFFIDDASLQWFPVAVRDTYGYWAAPVFFYEALAALVIGVVCVFALLRGGPGKSAVLFLALLSLSQILLDSWRQDEYIRFGFVHLNQIAGVVVLAGVFALSLANRVKENGWNVWQTARFTAFVILVGVLIWVEFALDKSNIENSILYIVMTAALIAMGVAVLYEGQSFRSGSTKNP